MTEQHRQTILIVDDDSTIILAFSGCFRKEYEVLAASNGDEALAILKKQPVDLIVADYWMPGMNGVELFQQVSSQYPLIGRILLTSSSSVMEAAINQGAVDKFLEKPWDTKQLRECIQQVLRSRAVTMAASRMEIEAQLIHCDKMASLGGLLAGVAHEINNPLSFVASNLTNLGKFIAKVFDLLECYEQLDLPAEMRAVVDKKREAIDLPYLRDRIPGMIDKSVLGADRMKKILLELKVFSRAAVETVEKANIHEALDSVLDILHNEYKSRIEVKKEYGDLPLVTCNISKLVQVFMNILMNACHAMPEQGEIRLQTEARDGLVSIVIGDTGSGIPEEVRQHIFEPFFTTKPAGKGTGLGLSISQAIIQQHRGTISVASTMGEGTTFTITLPVEAAAAAA